MTMRSVALFAYFLGMLALFVALALEWLTIELVRTTGGAKLPSLALNALRALPRFTAAAVGLILLSGSYLAAQVGVLGFAWVRVSLAAMVLMGVLGAIALRPVMGRVKERGAREGAAATAALQQSCSHPFLRASLRMRVGVGLGIVYVMLVIGGALVLGALATVASREPSIANLSKHNDGETVARPSRAPDRRFAMILITGATGNVGREVVNLLLAESQQVVGVSRHPPQGMFTAAAQVIAGDPSQPDTLASALNGVSAILLSPRAVGAAAAPLLTLAARRGVRRAVLLSALTVEYGGGYRRFIDEFRAIEDAVKGSGLEWTLLRSADYAANARAWAPQIRTGDVVRGAYGDAATSTIHERDVAAVAARALVGSKHVGRAYVLTGPQSISQRDKVRTIGQAIGKNVPWQEIPPEQGRQAMLARGLPEYVPDRMLGYLADCVQTPGPSSNTVEQILQRPALTFGEWAAEHAAEFRN